MMTGIVRRNWFGVCSLRIVPVLAGLAIAIKAAPPALMAQMPRERSIYDRLRYTNRFMPPSQTTLAPPAPDRLESAVAPTPPLQESPINADYVGRATVLSDDTRLAGFAQGNFLPSAIPVEGQPHFDSGSRADLQGSGSAVGVNAVGFIQPDVVVAGHAQFLVQNAGLASVGGADSVNVTIREAFGQINRLSIGVMESAFADPAAAPESLDLAGPNARITANAAGLGEGQGRLSYNLFSDGAQTGLMATLSVEQPLPQIETDDATATFAHYPDFVGTIQYINGDIIDEEFFERWHVQFGTVLRDLGLEDDTNTFRRSIFGWGIALSGSYRIFPIRTSQSLDRLMFSVAYGEGISHYVADLNAAPDTGDAVIDGAGLLVPLPVLAWYLGYTHNWTDSLRSTATYSRVDLDSVLPLGAAASPYRAGDYVAMNLVFHTVFQAAVGVPKPTDHNFFTGVEALFGQKETLDGAEGDAQRIMWVTAISN